MDDVHQKTILLKHTTVKVPGKRPPKATTPGQGNTIKLLNLTCCYLAIVVFLDLTMYFDSAFLHWKHN